ncbi:IclR family transcriptional regulator [Aminobacterium sp. MB27-C1]|uniref:IclR family transcriptional regulator n=1 Tax=Aminobacterium sp. MB27-C1 TaxID=3070661 RepID=UPI0027DBE4F0|nr:IclR family transcriptional regulator [Aminobacterium sp. MB27-C1]WMI71424.1 IclR family transcriptional regulator [Aminobacterium sp. MB27-C1]
MIPSSSRHDTIHRIITIMETLSKADNLLSIREIEEQTGIPRTTVHRFLHSLQKDEWVYQDPITEKFRTGIRFYLLFNRRAFYHELIQLCDPHMKDLLSKTGKTVLLSVLNGTGGKCIHSVEPETALKFVAHKGMTIPLHAGATGKILLAFAKPEIQEIVLSQELERFSSKTITNPDQLKEQIKKIQTEKYSFSQEEWMINAGDLSIPVFDHSNQFICQLGLASLSSSFDGQVEILLNLLKEAGRQISSQL